MHAPVLHGLMLVTALAAFAWILRRRLVVLKKGAPDPRGTAVGERLKRLLVVGFGQARQPRYVVAGVLHILIFFGFLILLLRSLTLLGEGFVEGFHLPGLGGEAGKVYLVVKDVTAYVVLACCVVAAVRRLVFKPARYHDRHALKSHHHEAYLILGLIALLLVSDFVYEGAEGAVSGTAFWIHNATLLFFLCYLPVSKHFHVMTALPNVYLSNVRPGGSVKPPRWGTTNLDDLDRLGAANLEDFTWKHVLDFYTCTDCGRCSDHCPAYATGTPLSPRMISIKSRDLAYETYPVFGKDVPEAKRPSLLGDLITEGEVWACTTCGACEEACPVMIEYVDKIVDMRRSLVEDGRVPKTIQKALADVEKRGNPYGMVARKRDDLGLPALVKGGECDALYFTDSCTAFDPRIQQIGQAFARVLGAAGVEAATLGKDEVDSGHEVRRMGEEGLFEVLRDKNREAIGARSCERIVTNDPHAWNALKNDYEDVDVPVRHHSQVLAQLLASGSLTLKPADGDERTYVFHDPCYLGRHGGEYEAPRQVLKALGLETREMERSRNRSFCCGGGSLYLFYEGESESRMSETRLKMAEEAGADVLVTACPFCLINFEDAVKTTARQDKLEVIDLAELVARRLEDGSGD